MVAYQEGRNNMLLNNSDEFSFDDDIITNTYNRLKNNDISTDADIDDDLRDWLLEESLDDGLCDVEDNFTATIDDKTDNLFVASPLRNNRNTTRVINYLKQHPNPLFDPLTTNDEIRILNKYLKTDLEHLKYLLFCHHIRLVFSIAGNYFKRTNEFDEMVSRGYDGLMQAINNFDFKRCLITNHPKKIKFSTYATFWIRKYVIWEFAKDSINLTQKNISLDKVISDGSVDGENGSTTLENYLSTKAITESTNNSVDKQVSCIFARELIDDIHNYIYTNTKQKFEQYDYEIFRRIFYENNSIKDISSDMNLSVNYVNSRKYKIIHQIKDMLHQQYGITNIYDIF